MSDAMTLREHLRAIVALHKCPAGCVGRGDDDCVAAEHADAALDILNASEYDRRWIEVRGLGEIMREVRIVDDAK